MMNIYPLQFLIIFICYLNVLVFTGISYFSCWTLDVSRTASYEIILVRLSVCLSIRPSLNFLKIGSLVFSDIGHDDSLTHKDLCWHLCQYRLEIEMFNASFYIRSTSNTLWSLTPLPSTIDGILITFLTVLLILYGYIELNPEPSKNVTSCLISPFVIRAWIV